LQAKPLSPQQSKLKPKDKKLEAAEMLYSQSVEEQSQAQAQRK